MRTTSPPRGLGEESPLDSSSRAMQPSRTFQKGSLGDDKQQSPPNSTTSPRKAIVSGDLTAGLDGKQRASQELKVPTAPLLGSQVGCLLLFLSLSRFPLWFRLHRAPRDCRPQLLARPNPLCPSLPSPTKKTRSPAVQPRRGPRPPPGWPPRGQGSPFWGSLLGFKSTQERRE